MIASAATSHFPAVLRASVADPDIPVTRLIMTVLMVTFIDTAIGINPAVAAEKRKPWTTLATAPTIRKWWSYRPENS
jgi:hypothetical protein